MMKTDQNLENAWTKEGPICYRRKEDSRVHSIEGLYEGGQQLKYHLNDVEYCFEIN